MAFRFQSILCKYWKWDVGWGILCSLCWTIRNLVTSLFTVAITRLKLLKSWSRTQIIMKMFAMLLYGIYQKKQLTKFLMNRLILFCAFMLSLLFRRDCIIRLCKTCAGSFSDRFIYYRFCKNSFFNCWVLKVERCIFWNSCL